MSYSDPVKGEHSWALDAGINFFDTANAYGNGASEEVVGRALKDFAAREEYVLATKLYSPLHKGANATGLSRKAVFAEVDASLKRLGHDYIDLYQIHLWDVETPIVGATKLRHLDDAIGALSVKLEPEHIARLEAGYAPHAPAL